MIVNIQNIGAINLPQNNYTNCHEFSRAVILGLANIGHIPNVLQNCVQQLQQAQGVPAIIAIYNNMLQLQNAGVQQFSRNTMNNIVHAPGLIIFELMQISHSMIVIGPDSWEGANNLNSLGAPDVNVHIYNNMQNWMFHNGTNGGWNGNNQMCSIYGNIYTMYYIPL